MLRTSFLFVFLLAFISQKVQAKPACGCPTHELVPKAPEPCATPTNAPCCKPEQQPCCDSVKEERITTSTTTSTTTTTTLPPPVTSSSPKINCVNPPQQRCRTCAPLQNTPKATPCNPCTTTTSSKVPCSIPEKTTTTAKTTTTTTTTPQPPTPPPATTPSPKTNCVNGEIYPASVGNCDQFLMCRNRVFVLMMCPPGLGFNYQTKSCDWSTNVPACNA